MEAWNAYREKMNHELDDTPVRISLLVKGYKLDGENGIKKAIGVDKLRSVDYIAENDSLTLVEFTDLYRQQDEILDLIRDLRNTHDLSKKNTRKVNKILRQSVLKELREKYLQTLLIIDEMQKIHFCNQLAERSNNQKYWIIVSPFHPAIAQENKSEMARFLDMLQNTLTTAFPKKWNIKVQIIVIEKFAIPRK